MTSGELANRIAQYPGNLPVHIVYQGKVLKVAMTFQNNGPLVREDGQNVNGLIIELVEEK